MWTFMELKELLLLICISQSFSAQIWRVGQHLTQPASGSGITFTIRASILNWWTCISLPSDLNGGLVRGLLMKPLIDGAWLTVSKFSSFMSKKNGFMLEIQRDGKMADGHHGDSWHLEDDLPAHSTSCHHCYHSHCHPRDALWWSSSANKS